MAKLQDYELEEQYKEMLDECYPPVKVAGYEYETSRALYELDPIAYREGFNNWLDSLDNCEDCDENPISCKCIVCGACGFFFQSQDADAEGYHRADKCEANEE